MALSTSVHDLRTLIRSFHPLIVIETVEEDRVLSLLHSVAAQERMPLFEWSITRGLTRHDDGPTLSKMTATPLALLQHLNGLTVEGIFWLKDLCPHLQDAAVARQLREVATTYSRSRATCVITGEPISLPPDLERMAVRYQLNLPDQDELDAMLGSVLQSLDRRALQTRPRSTTIAQSILGALSPSTEHKTGLAPNEHAAILRALRGMTLHQARQVVTQCVMDDGALTANDVQTILDRKVQAVKDGARLRLRPKVMTVATIVCSLLPIMWSSRQGAEVMKPLATPVIGGMISSLIHILIVTPVIFLWLRQRELRSTKP